MRVRKLSATGDYTFGQSQKNFWRDVPEAVGQVVGTSLKLWLGEFYWDVTLGVPFMQGILGKHSKDEADSTIQYQVSQVQGVTGIEKNSYVSTLDPTTRGLSLAFTIDTLYGKTPVQIANYLNY